MIDSFNQVESYKQLIINITNQCGLTPGMAYYVLRDVEHELYKVYSEQAKEQEEPDEIINEEIEVTDPKIIESINENTEKLSQQISDYNNALKEEKENETN